MFGVYLANVSGITRQEIIKKVFKSNHYQKPEVMNFIEEFIHEGIEKGILQGIEKGKKIAIYEAYLRGNSLELLSNVFDLPLHDIKRIVEEMKNELEK